MNQELLDNLSEAKPPLLAMLGSVAPTHEAACAWAAGFVSGCELVLAAWARSGHKVTGQTGPFGRLRALAARADVPLGKDRVARDDGSPLLQAMDAAAPTPVELAMALAELWPVVVANRLNPR